jgi:hypothetical protein
MYRGCSLSPAFDLSGSQTPLVVTDAPVSCDIYGKQSLSRDPVAREHCLAYLLLSRTFRDQIPVPEVIDVDVVRESPVVLLVFRYHSNRVRRRARSKGASSSSAHGCCYSGSDGG